MFVLCPHCQFLVAVDPASGLPPARCPRCDGLVLATGPAGTNDGADVATAPGVAESVADGSLPADKSAHDALVDTAPVDEPAVEMPPEPGAAEAIDASPERDVIVDPAPVEARPVEAPAAATPRTQSAPSFVRLRATHADPARPRRRWRSVSAVLGLSLLLAVQILVADRAQLAADAQWRPAIALLCAALRCELPPWREPAAFTLLDRDVAPDPSHPGVLHVTARFRNDARWSQPWPQLVLTLSDVDGRIAGARVFQPRDYLAHDATKNGLASGQSANVVMDIIEPAPRIVAFTFDFR
jgi:hypothetical protein